MENNTIHLEKWDKYFGKECKLNLQFGEAAEVTFIKEWNEKAKDLLIIEQEKILDKMLQILIQVYPDWQEGYGYDEDERQEIMPDVTDMADFKKLINPKTLYVLDVMLDGALYLGFEFDCTWDESHGLGFMMHRNRVVAMGGADHAFLTWIAERDRDL